MIMPIKIVFFDKNHCIFRLEGITRVTAPRVMQEILGDLNTVANINQIVEAWKDVFDEIVRFYGEDSMKLYDYNIFLKHMIEKFFVTPTEEQLENAYKKLTEGRAKSMEPNEGVEKVLGDLRKKNIKVALLTNSYYDRALYQLNRVGLLKYFNFVITSDLLNKTKLDEDMYSEALRLTQTNAIDAMMVSASNMDMINAKKVGMTTVKLEVPPDEFLISMEKTNPDFKIRRMPELMNLPLLK
jgi:HAD superfamily hydrolase (TIGR01509 family)